MKIGIFGIGNMGGAILDALQKAFPDDTFWVYDPKNQNLEPFPEARICTDPDELAENVEGIIFAVKTNALRLLLQEISVDISKKLIVSVMAGVSIQTLMELTQSKRIVRAMPNLPIKVHKGVVAWHSSQEVTHKEKRLVEQLFSPMGTQLEVDREELVDAVTVVSGSGPAYFFYLCELLMNKAMTLGFSEEQSRVLAESTFVGSAKLLAEGKHLPHEWVDAVTSPGGTTEEALRVLKEKNFKGIFFEALEAAKNRLKSMDRN